MYCSIAFLSSSISIALTVFTVKGTAPVTDRDKGSFSGRPSPLTWWTLLTLARSAQSVGGSARAHL